MDKVQMNAGRFHDKWQSAVNAVSAMLSCCYRELTCRAAGANRL